MWRHRCVALSTLIITGLVITGQLLTAVTLAQNEAASNEAASNEAAPKLLPGTAPLQMNGDITSELVAGVDRFLLQQLAEAPAQRQAYWPKLVHTDRQVPHPLAADLASRIGLRDARLANPKLQLLRDPRHPLPYLTHAQWQADLVRWPVFSDVDAEGIYVRPVGATPVKFQVVIVPDAGQTPEQLVGVGPDHEATIAWAANLAAIGGEVVVTNPVSRHREARRGRAKLTDQEYLYRSAFELGRHVLGYQVHEALAAVAAVRTQSQPMIVIGWGEGGWVALHAAAVDQAIDAVCVSGHFQSRDQIWQEPIHRNVQGLLTRYGDAELAAMIAPRALVVDNVPGPQVEILGEGGAPGKLSGPTSAASEAEFNRAQQILKPYGLDKHLQWITPSKRPVRAGASVAAVQATLAAASTIHATSLDASQLGDEVLAGAITPAGELVSAQERRLAMVGKWDRFSQRVLEHAADERAEYWKDLKLDSLENFKSSVEPYREKFATEVIGRWELPLLPPQPRTRLAYQQEKWIGYDVVLDVYPEVIAYGVLLLPRDHAPGERRPCVVFQHGLEGRPQDCIEGDHPAYHDVAAKLAERGFVVFAPQNLYIFHDRFRTLQRKSNPLGKTLFSTIVPQHQQICRWLGQLPQVDPSRIAFYGLSYGGKSAMRIPPLVPEYCLSICSADFNDWVWKNASTHAPHSYVWTMEYEIYEFDLGGRFNYAEMATLIAPRPFMVERGHFDGVGPDDRVGAEFAKVRHLYSAKLGLTDAAQIEWFVGPHTINGQGTYQFLHDKLNFPSR